jgi:two-component system, chemotaxis family, sensor kinase CheA
MLWYPTPILGSRPPGQGDRAADALPPLLPTQDRSSPGIRHRNATTAHHAMHQNPDQHTDSLPGGSRPRAPAPSLDDLAAMLIQTEIDDAAGIVRLRDETERLARSAALPPMVGALLEGSLARFVAADRGAGSVEEALQDLGETIEAVMKTLARSSAHAPAPAPVAPPPPPAAAACLPADTDAGLLSDFIDESLEYMAAAEAALLALESDPADEESINVVFRAFHTVKGTSAFLGLDPVTELAHHAESVLSRVRDGEIQCAGPVAEAALVSADLLAEMIRGTREAVAGAPLALPGGLAALMRQLCDLQSADAALLHVGEPSRLGDILVADGAASREQVEQVAAARPTDELLGMALIREHAATPAAVGAALRKQKTHPPDPGADSVVRVRTDRLDQLVDLLGELVVSHSMVSQDATVVHPAHFDLHRKLTQSGKIVRELQQLGMSLRMVPLKPVFHKMSRLVRDVAKKSGKLVEFVTEGEETEVDRTMADLIGDPLVHMIRNGVDHGIEPPGERDVLGKPRAGRVTLSASYAGGSVVVVLRDDGRGLNRERILAKAIEKGLVDCNRSMSDGEVFNLIFAPGFSTAEQVTDLSGRGVGMDVVRRNIEALRGRVEITSEQGRGTTFAIHLPLTLAVTDGMIVSVGAERYIVPTTNIHMSFRPAGDMLSTIAGRGEMVLLHGELLPILRLHRLYEVHGAEPDPTRAILMIVGEGDRRTALLVDALLGQQQCVTKPLGEGVGKLPGIVGGAIMGDGRVGLILDIADMVALARREGRGARPAGPAPPETRAA